MKPTILHVRVLSQYFICIILSSYANDECSKKNFRLLFENRAHLMHLENIKGDREIDIERKVASKKKNRLPRSRSIDIENVSGITVSSVKWKLGIF